METSGKPIAEIARDLGINDNNLFRWRGRYGSQPQTNTHGSVAEIATELKHLQCGNEVLRNVVERVVVNLEGEIDRVELSPPFAYLRDVCEKVGGNEGTSETPQ
jgi:transposase-like protein